MKIDQNFFFDFIPEVPQMAGKNC